MAAAVNAEDKDCLIAHAIKDLESKSIPRVEDSNKAALAVFPESEPTDLLLSLYAHATAVGTTFTQPSPSFYHFWNNRTDKMKKAYHVRDSVLGAYAQEAAGRLAESGDSFEPKSALDYMVLREANGAKKAGRAPVFDSPRIIQLMFGYLLGGQDSTHSTLSFMVKHLGEEQEIQKELRVLLHDAYPEAYRNREQPPLKEMVKVQIPYLDAFIEEVLRLSNPAVGVGKETLKDIEILGYKIPKGTTLMFSFLGGTFQEPGYTPAESVRSESSQKHAADGLGDWGMSEYPAHEFHPERWLRPSEEEGESGPVFNNKAGPMLSFSAGTRGCWGKRLAYLELKLVTTLLVWNFAFKKLPREIYDFDIAEELFLKPRTCRVRLASAWDE